MVGINLFVDPYRDEASIVGEAGARNGSDTLGRARRKPTYDSCIEFTE